MTRGLKFEGIYIGGGSPVSLVNCQAGYNANSAPFGVTGYRAPNVTRTRPNAGVFVGGQTGSSAFVGGFFGWLGNAQYAQAQSNTNKQDYGLVLGGGWSNTYTRYALDLYGNVIGRIGQQTTGTGATTVLP